MSTLQVDLPRIYRPIASLIEACLGLEVCHAKWKRLVTFFAVAVSLGTPAYAQRHTTRQGTGGAFFMKSLNDDLNRQNDAKKKATLRLIEERVRQDNRIIEECESMLSNFKGDLAVAGQRIKDDEKSLDEIELKLRGARKERVDVEQRILAEQEADSHYRVALKELQDAEEASLKHAEQILKHSVSNGNSQKLRVVLPKSEFKLLESNQDWVNASLQYNKAKTQLAEATKQHVLGDKAIIETDATIRKLNENQKKQKAQLTDHRKNFNGLQKKANQVRSRLETVKSDRDEAEQVLTQIRR